MDKSEFTVKKSNNYSIYSILDTDKLRIQLIILSYYY